MASPSPRKNAAKKARAPAPSAPPGSRLAFIRMAAIIECFDQTEAPSLADLQAAVRDRSRLEVVGKTITRDLAILAELGYRIEYERASHGYVLKGRGLPLPRPQFTPDELAMLCLMRGSLDAYAGTPVHAAMASAFKKLGLALSEALEISPGLGQFTAPMHKAIGAKEDFFQALIYALADQQRVRFLYQKPQEKRPARRLVEPYHVTARAGRWYLVGRDVDKGELRTFALARITAFELLGKGECFERPTDFQIDDYFRHSLGVMCGPKEAKPVPLTIRFDDFAAPYLREQFVHVSQRFREGPDGSLELTLVLTDFMEAERLVLQWAGHAEALAPAEFRDRVAASSRRLAALHGG